MRRQWLYILITTIIPNSFAQDVNDPKACTPINPVFVTHNVFSKDEPNYFWLLGAANNLHITTKASTLKNALSSFDQCQYEVDDYEIERYFRRLPYIRDAKVRNIVDNNDNKRLFIETWDNWTLQPNVSFGRKGSENTWSIGIAEGNILGLGIATNINYYSNPDRTGYVFSLDTPIKLGYLFDTSVAFSKNNDGYSQGFNVESPFVSKNTPWASAIQYNNQLKQSTIRLGHFSVNKFEHQVSYTNIWWGWANIGSSANSRQRFKIGFSSDKHIFSNTEDTRKLPEDREYSYPWFQYAYLSDRFTKMQNIYLINSIEDINLGINFWVKLGYDLSPSHSPIPYLWFASFKKASRISENWLYSFILLGEGNGLDNGKNRFRINSISEFFYTPHRLFTLYNKFMFTASENEHKDSPVTLGDNTGLIGYPLQYAHGDHFFVYQTEIRYYPRISLYQIIELGGAIFYGAGKVFGRSDYENNNNNSLLQSVGFGLRFYSARSSNGNTLYLDFARPISNDKELNRWEWRIRGKSQF